jgi:hypothetical protein
MVKLGFGMGMAARIHITANFILAVLVVNTIGTPLQWEQIRPVGNGPRSRYMHASASFESAQVKSRFAPCILDKKTGAGPLSFFVAVALGCPLITSLLLGCLRERRSDLSSTRARHLEDPAMLAHAFTAKPLDIRLPSLDTCSLKRRGL